MPVYDSQFVTSQDGLRLHVRLYGPRTAAALPVICLPGLARTGADFDTIATALASEPEQPRRIAAIDYRGRGRSDYDSRTANYNIFTELGDVLAVITALGIEPAVFVGTSRGGILAMLLATARPAAIAGVVLNDIGPIVEPRGLMRIKGYVGRLPQARSFEECADILRRLFGSHFPRLGPQDWLAFAKRTFTERDGRLVPDYDSKLAKTLKTIAPERPLPTLWREFDALAGVPVMVIRGANSDILSAATVGAMRSRRPDLETVEVPDQGHAPLLAEPEIISAVGAFLARCAQANRY